mmetsp:Transcript_19111/g.62299  ORF Transcript_19111/g.62299 Transcript_19111/m.62299 type:complete len:487 (-) Transcript_19111:316-1776(-)
MSSQPTGSGGPTVARTRYDPSPYSRVVLEEFTDDDRVRTHQFRCEEDSLVCESGGGSTKSPSLTPERVGVFARVVVLVAALETRAVHDGHIAFVPVEEHLFEERLAQGGALFEDAADAAEREAREDVALLAHVLHAEQSVVRVVEHHRRVHHQYVTRHVWHDSSSLHFVEELGCGARMHVLHASREERVVAFDVGREPELAWECLKSEERAVEVAGACAREHDAVGSGDRNLCPFVLETLEQKIRFIHGCRIPRANFDDRLERVEAEMRLGVILLERKDGTEHALEVGARGARLHKREVRGDGRNERLGLGRRERALQEAERLLGDVNPAEADGGVHRVQSGPFVEFSFFDGADGGDGSLEERRVVHLRRAHGELGIGARGGDVVLGGDVVQHHLRHFEVAGADEREEQSVVDKVQVGVVAPVRAPNFGLAEFEVVRHGFSHHKVVCQRGDDVPVRNLVRFNPVRLDLLEQIHRHARLGARRRHAL